MSLWEVMQHYAVLLLVHSINFLKNVECNTNHVRSSGLRDSLVPKEEIETSIHPAIQICRRNCEAAQLTSALARIDERFRIPLRDGITYDQLYNEAKCLREAIEDDLRFKWFGYVDADKARHLIQLDHDWAEIFTKFPATKPETTDAIRSYAFGNDTACAFHLMRVSEHGLRALARKVGVRLTHKGRMQQIEYAEWVKVITGVNTKLQAMRALHPGRIKTTRLQFYADAADHCLYMKELRNEISHTRKRWNTGEALGTIQWVQAFMRFLASAL